MKNLNDIVHTKPFSQIKLYAHLKASFKVAQLKQRLNEGCVSTTIVTVELYN